MNTLSKEILEIVTTEAFKTLAKAHHTTVENVKFMIQSGNEVACREFQKLCKKGWEIAKEEINGSI